MDKEKLYYEEIVCDIQEIRHEDLFIVTRKQAVVWSRHLCIYYMREYLNYSFQACASRYGKDHATAIHSFNVVKTMKEVDTEFKKIYNEFISRCRKGRRKLDNELTFSKITNGGERGNHVVFINNVIKTLTKLQVSLYNFIDYEEDVAEVLERIDFSSHGITELRKFFDYDNQGTVDTEDNG